MKLALLLCSLGWFGSPFPSCTGFYLDGTEVDPADNPNAITEALFRSARTSDPDYSHGGGDVMVDYRTLRAIMGPRRHRFLHFGRKRALPNYIALSTDPQDDDESDDAYRSAEMSSTEVADENLWLAKRSLSDGSNRFIHFGKRFQDGRQIRYKRETGSVLRLKENSSLETDQSKPAAFEIHNEDDPNDAETSSRVPQRKKRSSNRMLHFGKRGEGYDTEGENMQDREQDGVKRATNKMLHFGKRMEDDTPFGAMEEAYRDESNAEKRSSNRILHFGKRKPEVTPVGVPLGYAFQSPGIEEKRSNRILHFGKREPELPGGGEPLLSDFERPGSDEKRANRILHFGKRMGVDEYPAAVSYADLYKKMETKRGPQGHRILHFGKREEGKSSSFFEDDDEAGEANRSGNKMLNIERRRPFGSSAELRDQLQRNFVLWKKRSSNRMLHFGKRQKIFDEPTNAIKDEDYSNVSNEYNEAGNVDKRFKDSMLHFGKRGNDPFPRTQNRIMHFGKRGNEFNLENSPEIGKNPGDRLLSYEQGITHLEGIGGTDKHSQYRDARSQTPSLENVPSGSEGQKGFLNDSGTPGGRAQSTRTKRSIVNTDNIDATLERVLTDLSNAGYAKRFAFGSPGLLGTLHLPHAVVAARDYGSILPPRMLSRPSRSDRIPVTYSGQHGDKPKGASRNVFLRFG